MAYGCVIIGLMMWTASSRYPRYHPAWILKFVNLFNFFFLNVNVIFLFKLPIADCSDTPKVRKPGQPAWKLWPQFCSKVGWFMLVYCSKLCSHIFAPPPPSILSYLRVRQPIWSAGGDHSPGQVGMGDKHHINFVLENTNKSSIKPQDKTSINPR